MTETAHAGILAKYAWLHSLAKMSGHTPASCSAVLRVFNNAAQVSGFRRVKVGLTHLRSIGICVFIIYIHNTIEHTLANEDTRYNTLKMHRCLIFIHE